MDKVIFSILLSVTTDGWRIQEDVAATVGREGKE
tara:strand:+ start:360 stop:461 length:102 start_codon:yes stop_codon:yes gene_type:complete